MDTAILSKEKLKDFLKSLGDVSLMAPVKVSGKTAFGVVEDLDAAELDLDDYTASTKKVMFPQTETMFAFRNKGGEIVVEEARGLPRTVVFGIRPCDAKSFVVLDPLFTRDIEDPYYQKRREATVLIGHACAEPTSRCFCPSVGGSPAGTEGLDLLLVDVGSDYYLEAVTDKGKEILKAAGKVVAKAAADKKKAKDAAAAASLKKIRRSVDVKGLQDDLPKVFDNGFWKDVGNKCIGCGICTYNCPTCHCFDIQDEGSEYQGRRIRVWDACMYPEFTVHASGENPRHDRSTRIRNRLMHKFTYYPQNQGHIGCVGCGRCIELCPVNEDLIEILTSVRDVIS
ncbi:MAG: (4Fe-4S)-binding protein [Deltaproteobacteria bacterium]|nr:(4Fe-4S)-binding protein [Deltaproteobacteria bacterium]